jgi:hypothetical protein
LIYFFLFHLRGSVPRERNYITELLHRGCKWRPPFIIVKRSNLKNNNNKKKNTPVHMAWVSGMSSLCVHCPSYCRVQIDWLSLDILKFTMRFWKHSTFRGRRKVPFLIPLWELSVY